MQSLKLIRQRFMILYFIIYTGMKFKAFQEADKVQGEMGGDEGKINKPNNIN